MRRARVAYWGDIKMPVEVDLAHPPAGHVIEAAKKGEMAKVAFREFTSTEDGQLFVQRLEAVPSDILAKLPNRVIPSQVDNMLAIIRSDGKATVYMNELKQSLLVRAARPVQAGMPVMKDDIADIERLELGVTIQDNSGFLFLFSIGWRKGLFYDYGPVIGKYKQPRGYDIGVAIGRAYCHVLFQNRFSISEKEWDAIIGSKWFPFIGLSDRLINELIQQVRHDWEPDEKLEEIVKEVKERVPGMIESWREHLSFLPHICIIDRGVERFLKGDYISCTGLLFPRIEGIMRTYYASQVTKGRASPVNLTASAVAAKRNNEHSLFLPHRFEAYLRDVYFAGFSPRDTNIDISRHSVAHGVASASEFDRKSAVISILIIHQLFYFLENGNAVTQAEVGVGNA